MLSNQPTISKMSLNSFTSLALALALLLCASTLSDGAGHAPLFIFGDSLYDAGNNNYLSGGKINVAPYGNTFFKRPTGRVCDGRIIPDFIAQYMNLPLVKPYLEPGFTNYTNGASFASSGAGILPSVNPGTLNLPLQMSYLSEVEKKLKQQLGDSGANSLMSNAIYLFALGGNDYMTLLSTVKAPAVLTSAQKKQYMQSVLGNFTSSIKKIYGMGGRKFGFQNVGPLGCMPAYIAASGSAGTCGHEPTVMAKMHNVALPTLLKKLETQLPGIKYTIYDYYSPLTLRTFYPTKYGFTTGKSACCGSGIYNGSPTCGSTNGYNLCTDPSLYVWWDAAHPTEALNNQLAAQMWAGGSDVTQPINMKTLFEM